jgi:hypothetical protein
VDALLAALARPAGDARAARHAALALCALAARPAGAAALLRHEGALAALVGGISSGGGGGGGGAPLPPEQAAAAATVLSNLLLAPPAQDAVLAAGGAAAAAGTLAAAACALERQAGGEGGEGGEGSAAADAAVRRLSRLDFGTLSLACRLADVVTNLCLGGRHAARAQLADDARTPAALAQLLRLLAPAALGGAAGPGRGGDDSGTNAEEPTGELEPAAEPGPSGGVGGAGSGTVTREAALAGLVQVVRAISE